MEAPSTPPAATTRYDRARTPPSPTHGPMHQDYEPYSPRRSSRRVRNPYSTQNLISKPISNHIPPVHTPKRPAFTFTPAELFPSSPPESPADAADNRKPSQLKTPRHADAKKASSLLDPSSSALKSACNLPTPTKTPTMTPARKHNRTASVENTARILHFQPDQPNDVMPQRRSKYKQKSIHTTGMHGLDLDGDDFSDRASNPSFEVYAESHARVPKLDESEENPFYRARATTIPPMRSSPRRVRKSAQQLAEEQRIDDAVARDEGMAFMFRGKKVFRKFQDVSSDSEMEVRDPSKSASQRALKRSVGASAARPLTRSAIAPRLLFAPDHRGVNDVDEEAETDVDMSDAPAEVNESGSTSFGLATPAKSKNRVSRMMSPPATSRTTRKRNAEDVSNLDDEQPEATPAKAAAALPTPQRSSKKKKVDINPIPTFEGEPTPVEEDASSTLTPQRSSRKKTIASHLTPIAEDQLPDPSSSTGSTTSRSRRSAQSPFDSWPRTKKRDSEPIETSSKRTRRSAA